MKIRTWSEGQGIHFCYNNYMSLQLLSRCQQDCIFWLMVGRLTKVGKAFYLFTMWLQHSMEWTWEFNSWSGIIIVQQTKIKMKSEDQGIQSCYNNRTNIQSLNRLGLPKFSPEPRFKLWTSELDRKFGSARFRFVGPNPGSVQGSGDHVGLRTSSKPVWTVNLQVAKKQSWAVNKYSKLATNKCLQMLANMCGKKKIAWE